MFKIIKNLCLILFLGIILISCPNPNGDPPVFNPGWSTTPAPGTGPGSPSNIAAGSQVEYYGNLHSLSLKVLQERLFSGDTTDEVLQLGGLTKIYGYVLDTENEDIILLGYCDSDLPVLHTEDFVIALQNAWNYYLVDIGGTLYYDYPGVTIDPDPACNALLNDLMSQYAAEIITLEELKTQWEATCISCQQPVGVFGMPFDSHFAKILVDADYDMKNIVNGSDQLGIDGLTSLMDLKVAQAEQGITDQGYMNRFWFSPENVSFLDDDGVVLLRECSVLLQTENMQGGDPDPLAVEFVQNFNNHFNDIAALRPIYKQMENLFRLFTIAQVMYYKNVSSTWISYLLNDFILPFTDVPDFKAGCSEIKEVEYTDPQGGGTYIIILPSCGGVTLINEIEPDDLITPSDDSCIHLSCHTLYINANGELTGVFNFSLPYVLGPIPMTKDTPEKTDSFTAKINDMISEETVLVVLKLSGYTYSEAEAIALNIQTAQLQKGLEPKIIFDRIDDPGTGIADQICNDNVTEVTALPSQESDDGGWQVPFIFNYQDGTLELFLNADDRDILEEILNAGEERISWSTDKTLNSILNNLLKDFPGINITGSIYSNRRFRKVS